MSTLDLDCAGVNYLVGGPSVEVSPLTPYDEETCSFLNDVSALLRADKRTRDYPDVVSFSYWCRKANINARREDAGSRGLLGGDRLGRGLAFHVAPSNIPVNFAFSFVFGLLAGCSNVVRVPSKPFAQVTLICDAINRALESHPALADRMAFVRYGRDDTVTGRLSSLADARIIWGGDATVEHIRALPSRPRCTDILFADRYSIGLIDGKAVLAAEEDEIMKLAEGFYNDTFLMDQNACSSPQMILWLNDSDTAKTRFWNAVRTAAEKRYQLQGAVVMDKYVDFCSEVIEGVVGTDASFDGLLSVLDVDELPDDIAALRGKGGFFHQHALEDFFTLAPYIDARYQTLCYFGVDAQKLREGIIERGLSGIDRIVPFGSAMDIDVIWDGYDLVATLSRIVDVR